MPRTKSEVAATLRLWPSSPIWSAWAVMLFRSIGPVAASVRLSVGPKRSRNQRSRSSTESSYAPKRRTLPRPSLSVANERLPAAVFSTTTTGIDGDTTPAIGPTAPW